MVFDLYRASKLAMLREHGMRAIEHVLCIAIFLPGDGLSMI
jgi:hypothetical protein